MTRGISIWPKESNEEVKARIAREMTELDKGDGVVILTDILGGTPTNQSYLWWKLRKLRLSQGVNMSMVLALSCYREGKTLREISSLARKAGRRSIKTWSKGNV